LRDGLGGGFGRRNGLLAGGLELDEELEVAAVVALGGIEAALDYGELLIQPGMRSGEGEFLVTFALHGTGPQGGLDAGIAFEGPGVADHGGEEDVLVRGGGLELVLVAGAEGFEVSGVFAGDERVGGEEAVFEGVEAGGGLALGGPRASGFFWVRRDKPA